MSNPLESLFFVTLVAAMAPIFSRIIPGPQIPPVVFMLLGGILIGEQGMDVAVPEDVNLLSVIGLSFLFLLAGYELDLNLMRQSPGKIALGGWFVSAGISVLVTFLLYEAGIIKDFLAIAIALTTTALGTLLPIMREAGMLDRPIGPWIFAAGAVGEFLPIVAMALFLTSSGPIIGAFALVGMAAVTFIAIKAIGFVQRRGVAARLALQEESTGQSTLRWTLVLLAALVLVADDFGLDIVIGAFLAGVVLRRFAPMNAHELERKLEAVGYGVFIPIFFVTSGMKLDIDSIVQNPGRLLLFFVLLLAVRGLPALFMYRRQLTGIERWQMVFLSATALPLLVALSEVGVSSGLMLASNAAALVGAGALSVLVFPLVAVVIERRTASTADAVPVR